MLHSIGFKFHALSSIGWILILVMVWQSYIQFCRVILAYVRKHNVLLEGCQTCTAVGWYFCFRMRLHFLIFVYLLQDLYYVKAVVCTLVNCDMQFGAISCFMLICAFCNNKQCFYIGNFHWHICVCCKFLQCPKLQEV